MFAKVSGELDVVFNNRGGAYEQGVYVCESKDIVGREKLVKPEIYNLNMEQLDEMQIF